MKVYHSPLDWPFSKKKVEKAKIAGLFKKVGVSEVNIKKLIKKKGACSFGPKLTERLFRGMSEQERGK